jgi:predicted MFS family arabinose efflux permease
VLCALLATYASSNTVMAVAGNYWVALGARLLGGLAHAGFFAAVFAAAVAIAPPAKAGRAIAVLGAGNALALTLGVPLGTALGTAVGWRWAFTACAVGMFLLAALTLVVLPASEPPSAAKAPLPVLTAVRRPPLLIMAGLVVVLTLGHYTPYSYISPLLLHAGAGPDGVSAALFCYGAAGGLGLLLAGAVVDRHPRRALQGATATLTAALLALGLLHSTAPAFAAVALWGLAFGTLPTLIQALALRASPQAPDAAPAVVNAAFNVGIAGGALIGAGELLTAAPPITALTGAALTAVALVLLSIRRLTSSGGQAPAGTYNGTGC